MNQLTSKYTVDGAPIYEPQLQVGETVESLIRQLRPDGRRGDACKLDPDKDTEIQLTVQPDDFRRVRIHEKPAAGKDLYLWLLGQR